jgi:hypothetical protein
MHKNATKCNKTQRNWCKTNMSIKNYRYIWDVSTAFSNLCSSAPIALRLGSSNRHRGCLTGLAFGSMLSACSTSSLGTPGMSEGHQAKISQCSQRNSLSTLSYVESKFTAMEVVFAGSMGWTRTFLESWVVLKAWSGRDRPTSDSTLWSVSPLSHAYSTVMPKVCAILLNSLSQVSDTSNPLSLWWLL